MLRQHLKLRQQLHCVRPVCPVVALVTTERGSDFLDAEIVSEPKFKPVRGKPGVTGTVSLGLTDVLKQKVAGDDERAKLLAATAEARLKLEQQRLEFDREREESRQQLEREKEQNSARFEFVKVVGSNPGLVTEDVQAMVGQWAKDLFSKGRAA